mgnify:CR=1 FL=1
MLRTTGCEMSNHFDISALPYLCLRLREQSRKKGKKDLNSSGKYVGYRRNPRDGFGRPNAPISKNNEE